MLATKGDSFEGKTVVVVSGSGNVAQYACEKATQLRWKSNHNVRFKRLYSYDPKPVSMLKNLAFDHGV